MSSDGHWLIFASTRADCAGDSDPDSNLWVSWRRHVHDDDAWEEPIILSAVNSPGFESGPTLFEDETGTTQLYFNSHPVVGGVQGMADIYKSTLGPDGFGPPTPVSELNSPVQEGRPYLRRDGREIYFQSNREGPMWLFVSSRASTAEPWTVPVRVPIDISGIPGANGIGVPALSWDTRELFIAMFWVNPPTAVIRVYSCSREKVKGKP